MNALTHFVFNVKYVKNWRSDLHTWVLVFKLKQLIVSYPAEKCQQIEHSRLRDFSEPAPPAEGLMYGGGGALEEQVPGRFFRWEQPSPSAGYQQLISLITTGVSPSAAARETPTPNRVCTYAPENWAVSAVFMMKEKPWASVYTKRRVWSRDLKVIH